MGKLSDIELEKKNLQFEIFRIGSKYGVKSFDELYKKIESGEVSETSHEDLMEDLIMLEYLEKQIEKYGRK